METQNLLTTLKRAGIKARRYRKAPFGKDVFALSIDRAGSVLVYQGNAKVKARGSKKHKQAVATITEGQRQVVRRVTSSVYSPDKDPNRVQISKELINSFGVIMPSNTHWNVRDIKWERIMVHDPNDEHKTTPGRRCDISGTVTGRVDATTTNHLLIGKDETRNFISPLPKPAKTVLEAHRMLRPKEAMKPGTRRQGEWFFVPVSRRKMLALNHYALISPHRVKQDRLGGGTHKALSTVSFRGDIYARGYIIDPRYGHHKSLYLPKWHKVIKNKEAELKLSPQQKAARPQLVRRSTWD